MSGTLDPTTFRLRAKALGVRAEAYLASHAVLVLGKPLRESARKHEIDPSQLHRTIKRIRDVRLCECCGQALPK